jgi:hypothetical protein
MGASLGSFGTVHPIVEQVDPDTFEWFGSTIRVTADVNEVELIDFMDTTRGIESKGLAALAAVKDGMRMLIHPDDFDTFWRLARQNRQQTDDLTELFMILIYGETDRPTQQPSDSSVGRLPTPESSPEGSSSPVSSSRPDLQLLMDDSAAERARIMSLAAG